MAAPQIDSERLLGALGLAGALLAGALLGMGQTGLFFLILLALLTFSLLAFALSKAAVHPEKVGFWILGLAVLAVPWSGIRITGFASLADMLLVVALPFVAYSLITRRIRIRLPNWLIVGAALLALSVILTELAPKDLVVTAVPQDAGNFIYENTGGSNLQMGARLMLALVVFPLFGVFLVRNWGQVSTLTTLWTAGVSISCAVALADAFLGTGLQEMFGTSDLVEGAFGAQNYGHIGADVRYVGLAFHPVALSLSVAMVIPVLVTRMNSRRGVAIYSPLLVLVLGASYLSGSRTGVVLLIATIVLFLLLRPRSRKPILWIVAILLGIAFVATWLDLSVLPERFTTASISDSDTERWQRINEGISNALARPFYGYGFEVSRHAHNTLLQLLSSGGFMALFGFLSVIFVYIRTGIRLESRIFDKSVGQDVVACALALIIFLVAGTFSNAIFDRYIYVPALIIMAAYALNQFEGNKQGKGKAGVRHQ